MCEVIQKKIIIVADDAKVNRMILKKGLEDEYTILEACDGEETLKLIAENYKNTAVVLLDISMPKIDGFQVMAVLNKKNVTRYLPIILITADTTYETMRKGYEYGVMEFITKPFDMVAVKKCIKNVVNLYNEKNKLEVMTIKQNKKLEEQAERLEKQNENILDMMGTVVEFRGAEGTIHIKRVKRMTRIMCKSLMEHFPEYQLTKQKAECIAAASCLHDIGKIVIPDSIVFKPNKLTDAEYEIIKGHTTKGCEIIDAIKDLQDPMYHGTCYDICRYHHERYDGNGYPEKLKAEEIPLAAQIVSIIEAFDALLLNNVVRASKSFEEAFNMIISGDCGVFSPKLLQIFELCREQFNDVYLEFEKQQ